MWERVQYRLPDGHIFEYVIDHSVGITSEMIDDLTREYFDHTGQVPEIVFVRTDMYVNYLRNLIGVARYSGYDAQSALGMNSLIFWSSIGQVAIRTVPDAYIPLLIGTQRDYDDNNINWLFEETILKDCERE